MEVDGWIRICAGDTVLHSWEVLASILSSDNTLNILCDIGMYVRFHPPLFFVITSRCEQCQHSFHLLHMFVCLIS